jgi:hypothetical protein
VSCRVTPGLLKLGGEVRAVGHEEDCGPLLRATAEDGKNGRHVLIQVTAPLSSPIPALSCRHVGTAPQNLQDSVGVVKRVSSHSLRIGATSPAETRRVAA